MILTIVFSNLSLLSPTILWNLCLSICSIFVVELHYFDFKNVDYETRDGKTILNELNAYFKKGTVFAHEQCII